MRRCAALPFAVIAVLSAADPAGAAAAEPACRALAPYLAAGAGALAGAGPTGPEGFDAYRAAVAGAARMARADDLADRLDGLSVGRAVPRAEADLAACLLRYYVRDRYGERMVADLRAMVGFKTVAEPGRESWDLPEFVRQREWLRAKAAELGLGFASVGGRVEEVTLAGPAPVLALLTHGDVQGVEGQQWSSPPWEARLVEGRMIGRGTEDDKGPIVAALYGLAALRDAGWPREMTVKLLVANDEESNWQDIPYYLERAPVPAMTVGLDAAYPVTHAQKGYGVLTIRAEPQAAPPAPAEWRVLRIAGGSGLSIIPERGEALLQPAGPETDLAAAEARLAKLAAAWAAAHTPARLAVAREGKHLKVTAEGRGGHSSVPASGHNALGDLTAFLASLDLVPDRWGALAGFVGTMIGTETDGRSLGIAHRDEAMGELTVSLGIIDERDGAPTALVNTRVPRGATAEEMGRRLAERAAAFTQKTGAPLWVESQLLSQPHLAPVEGELVSTLLSVWEEVTGRPGRPVAIGGGTQARLFPGGVDFGPAESMATYRGHGTDEYLTVEELHSVAELTLTAVFRLVGVGP